MATIYRNYKDNVFCLLYWDRANLLELYNGLNGTDHKDPEELTVVMLPNTICIQYKSDAAFTFSKDLYLCEQQATENPYMPLRLYLRGIQAYRDRKRSVPAECGQDPGSAFCCVLQRNRSHAGKTGN